MENLIINHIGYVVKSIENYLNKSLFKSIHKKIYDPIQNSNLALLTTSNDIYIELIEPVNEKATTYKFLQERGGGYHHICFIVKDIEQLNLIIHQKQIKIIWGPEPAVLFDSKKIYFCYTQNKELIEFIINES